MSNDEEMSKRLDKHESVSSMAQKNLVAAKSGMTVEEFKAKMKADRQRQTRELKKKLLEGK